ncbi:MAG: MFS transporter [Hydrogenophaga sp.]|uniref:MFS transporter n=1 Tax=Hydrogenophaga sp. TaxID=1904254 RepID=UPI001E031F40|nr:MFS transporter [Hydrogenophaga sp.]MBW0169458.1 MFS transporter [Hydrogenophaga sp.]MBW0183131.1 MFS transporter [Hydrogenophaga sp.]
MSNIHSLHKEPISPPRALVTLLAAGAGFSVASIYYGQPILGAIAADLGALPTTVGLLPMLTQLGYALGILLLAPLADRYSRRRVIVAKAIALTLALAASGLSPGMPALLVASFLVGLFATLAQDFVPAAASVAPPAHRGRIVGTVMTGLLLGILLSRTASGLIGQGLGWRAVYFAAAASVALIGAISWWRLPTFAPGSSLRYGALLASMVLLWRRHGALRSATLSQALLSVGFSAFWSTLALMLHADFGLGTAAAGSFGLAGAAGALAAPWAGRLADRWGATGVARAGAVVAGASFVAMAAGSALPSAAHLALLAVTAIGFDFGVQAALVAHQTLVYGLDAQARSRLNALLFTGIFLGMAAGSALGAWALAHWGWMGVISVAGASALAAFGVHGWPDSARFLPMKAQR